MFKNIYTMWVVPKKKKTFIWLHLKTEDTSGNARGFKKYWKIDEKLRVNKSENEFLRGICRQVGIELEKRFLRNIYRQVEIEQENVLVVHIKMVTHPIHLAKYPKTIYNTLNEKWKCCFSNIRWVSEKFQYDEF